MSLVKSGEVLQQVAGAVPMECRENIVIIGSLAAAYAYFKDHKEMKVQTKDIDCLVKPYLLAAEKCQEITKQLYNAGWHRGNKGEYLNPGTSETPTDKLPAIRLYPPGINSDDENAWFIELLIVPESSLDEGKKWSRIVIDEGHFGLPSFRYLSITAFNPEKIDQLGIYYARPQMLVLANLLEHPEIKPERMSASSADLGEKRSNKDLGRVLAIGYLAQESGLNNFNPWGYEWQVALQKCFPDEWKNLAKNTGNGLKELLQSDEDLEEAHRTCAKGLLSSYTVKKEDLKEVGNRILGEAVGTLENTLIY